MNSSDYLDRGWELGPDAPCMVNAETQEIFTYGDVRDITLRTAAALRADGHGVGSKAGVLSLNDALGFSMMLSIARAGMALIPVNARNSVQENAEILNAFDCEILFFSSCFEAAVAEFARTAKAIRRLICIDKKCEAGTCLRQWLPPAASDDVDLPHNGERLAVIQPTGGTTGFPKGAMLANRCIENMIANLLAVAPSAERPVFLAAAPLTHAAGYFFQYVLAQGGMGVLLPKADIAAILASIPKYRVSHLFLPPSVIYDLLSCPDIRQYDYSSLRYFFYGASPIAPEKLREALTVFGPVMAQIYGQSETGMPATFLAPREHFSGDAIASASRLASCGRPTPFSRVAIMDDDGRFLGPRETGEIVIAGQGVMLGYYKNPEATAQSLRNGWQHTGDVGYRDEEGFYYIVDRKKDMIVSGGFNVYSAEVERAVLSHPTIKECAVIGVPDAKWGEAVKAVVAFKPAMSATPQEIILHCKKLLGSVKAPKSVDVVDALPRSGSGKVLKREIRKLYWSGRGRMVS
jgi:acyl-CoA synthetase (AMP-forming)/AMP-acid ligase II